MLVIRYVAMAWDRQRPEAEQRAQRMLRELGGVQTGLPGVIVLGGGRMRWGSAPLVVGSGDGVVIGELFRASTDEGGWSGGGARVVKLDASESHRIVASEGRELISRYWGDYVAILDVMPETAGGVNYCAAKRLVLRAPMGTLPCFHIAIDDVDVYFSCLGSVMKLLAGSLTINWVQVIRRLVGPLLSEQTGLEEIHELLPGTCAEAVGPYWGDGYARRGRRPSRLRRYWDPVQIAFDRPLYDFGEAAGALRNAVLLSTRARAERCRRALHCLSGGLDSSVVLACLAETCSATDVTCLTVFADGAESDEREYARAAARRAGDRCRLLEWERTGDVDFGGALGGQYLPNCPGLRIRQVDRLDVECARDVRAEVVLKGHGGDELFCRHQLGYAAADLIRAPWGHRSGLGLLLIHAAVNEGTTGWSAFGQALRDAFIPRRWNLTAIFSEEQEDQSLVNPDLLRAVIRTTQFDLPFAPSTASCPPGKLWQISLVTPPRDFEGPHGESDDPPIVAPLLSQPVVETCLRIPSYLQVRDRGERAVARAAFGDLLPPEIINRRSKGGAEQLAWKMLRRNWRFTRERLLEGTLVKERIVNRQKLEAALSDSPSGELTANAPLFDLLGAEIWVQQWS